MDKFFVNWIKKISWPKVLLCALIYTVVATVIHQIEAVFTMSYYTMPEFFGVWSKLMMPASPASLGGPSAGPPPASFMVTSVILTFVSGISLALVYYYLRDILPKDAKRRVLFFADLMIALSFIFFTLPAYLLFNLPLALLVSWFISSFVILCAASFTFVKILR